MGPHGLVVGATGSGKSELLRTLVTGLAATHSPELLSLVLVDFKGGATFAGVTELPHVAGLITNLADDLALIERVRAALHGEQQRRQRMMRDAGNVDSLHDYQMRQAAGHTDIHGRPLEPLPYLLIIVDEFGELLSQRPDFIDLFVQIGRVGRSLGMHLLLATQRLEEGRLRGLESHLSYRICLRTFSAAESRAVIGTVDAYRLPSIPGSAYLKVDESVYERFRVAHVSGPYQDPEDSEQEFAPQPVTLLAFGLRTPPAADAVPEPGRERRPEPAALGGPTQMQVAIERLCRFGRPVHQVWVPPLPAAIPLDWLLGPVSVHPDRGLQAGTWPHCGELSFPLGVIDLPFEQQQQPLVVDFAKSHGNLAVVGAPQSGKSTLLRTAVLSAMLTHTPEEAQFYCVDYGGGTLQSLARAPHVGGVAGRHDEQRALRVLTEVHQLIGERERLFRELGVDSIGGFRGLRRAGKLPAGVRAADVFLVIDNWGALRAELDEAESIVVEVASRGLGAGVHLVLTANRWAEIRMNLRDAVAGRMELRLNDPSESEVSRQAVRQLAAGVPGRGIAPPGVLYHAALPRMDGLDSLDGLGDAQAETLDKIVAAWSGPGAPAVRVLPERIHVRELPPVPALAEPQQGVPQQGVPIGVGELNLEPVYLDLSKGEPHLLVFGDSGSGKSSFLRTWMRGLAACRTAWEARFMIVDYRRSLFDVAPPAYVGAYAGDAGAARVYAEQLVAKLAERMPPSGISARELRDRSWWEGPELYLVVDDYDLVGGGAQAPLACLADYLPQAREIGFHLVVARRTAGVSRTLMSDTLIARTRELGASGLLLSGDPHEGVLLGDQRAVPRAPGRAVLVRRQHPPTLVQVAIGEDEE
jgi:S-DNA-T family DNA segregation ATPase FtsK/SpoIIIE